MVNMRNFVTILGLLVAGTVLASPIQCFKTRQECFDLLARTPAEEHTHFACFTGTPDQCADILAEYEARETAKYKARNGDRSPSADYFDYSTATPLVVGGAEAGFAKTGILALFGVLVLTFFSWIGYLRFKNNK